MNPPTKPKKQTKTTNKTPDMKKSAILGLCLFAGLTASAQTSLVKDIERQMKNAPDKYPTNIETLKPAFTDPETAEGAYVWYVAGKGGLEFFDHQQGLMQIGQEANRKAMGHAIMDGYGYLINALERDSITDQKGKVKTKYSKDIFKLINSHYGDINNSAIYMWEAKDYDGAYDAWELYTTLPSNPLMNGNGPKALPDSTMSDIYYNQGLAAWQADKLEKALESFDKALAKGYEKKNLFDYAIAVSSSIGNTGKMAHYARLAMPLYGSEDNRYVGWIINDLIQQEKYDEAKQLLNGYIAAEPTNAQLYFVMGFLYDVQQDIENAKQYYLKTLELDPENAAANRNYGRQFYNQAQILDDQNSANMTTQEYNRLRSEQIDPLFREAIPYLEKAYQLNNEDRDALNILRNIYYNLDDAENLKRIEDLLAY